jgi:flagellar L-ring protein precursor FlgH
LKLKWVALVLSVAVAPSAGAYESLYGAHKASRVGDLVTVLISENSSAVQKAETSVKKDVKRDAKLAFQWQGNGTDAAFGGSAGDSHKGGGETQRSTAFTAKVTARITAVTPEGNLHLEGAQAVTVNEEKQNIMVKGTFRPEDVRTDNTILSASLADAEIIYKGKGSIARKQRPGLMTVLMNFIF